MPRLFSVLCFSTLLGWLHECILPTVASDSKTELNMIRRDGVYALYDTIWTADGTHRRFEVNGIYSPLLFVSDDHASFLNSLNFVDSGVLRLENHVAQGTDFNNYVGTYRLVGDTISATLPTSLVIGGNRPRLFPAHYTGIVKGSDTIMDWRMVPPYPKVNMRLNDSLKFLRAAHLLYFVESKELRSLDSLYQQGLREK